jgi:hypothetical protein
MIVICIRVQEEIISGRCSFNLSAILKVIEIKKITLKHPLDSGTILGKR